MAFDRTGLKNVELKQAGYLWSYFHLPMKLTDAQRAIVELLLLKRLEAEGAPGEACAKCSAACSPPPLQRVERVNGLSRSFEDAGWKPQRARRS